MQISTVAVFHSVPRTWRQRLRHGLFALRVVGFAALRDCGRASAANKQGEPHNSKSEQPRRSRCLHVRGTLWKTWTVENLHLRKLTSLPLPVPEDHRRNGNQEEKKFGIRKRHVEGTFISSSVSRGAGGTNSARVENDKAVRKL